MISQDEKLSKNIEPEHFSVVLYKEVLAFKFVNWIGDSTKAIHILGSTLLYMVLFVLLYKVILFFVFWTKSYDGHSNESYWSCSFFAVFQNLPSSWNSVSDSCKKRSANISIEIPAND